MPNERIAIPSQLIHNEFTFGQLILRAFKHAGYTRKEIPGALDELSNVELQEIIDVYLRDLERTRKFKEN